MPEHVETGPCWCEQSIDDLIARAERAETQLSKSQARQEFYGKDAAHWQKKYQAARVERDAARAVIRHAIQYWLPHDPTAAAFADFATWTDWADSNWTPAEATEIRGATGQPTEDT